MPPSASRRPSWSERPLDWVLDDLAAVLKRRLDAAAAERDRLFEEEDESAEALHRQRTAALQAAEAVARWSWVPIWGRRKRLAAERARRRLEQTKAELRRLRRQRERCEATQASLHQAYDLLVALGQRDYLVPDPMPERTARFVRIFEQARREGRLAEDALALASALSEILGDWALASVLAVSSGGEGGGRRRDGGEQAGRSVDAAVHRIYLPLSRQREREMVDAGARLDTSVAGGTIGRVWVGFDSFARFESLLPLVYRREPPELDFAEEARRALPVPPRSLSEIATARQLERLLRGLDERQGGRCLLCGGVGGLMWDRVRAACGELEARPLSLRVRWECRLVGPDTGLQRAVDAFAVCGDCELAFVGVPSGLQDEALLARVRQHVQRRRMYLMRCDATTMEGRLERQAEAVASLRAARRWLVDLSALAALPELAAGMEVRPEWLSAGAPVFGIARVSEDGLERVPARSLPERPSAWDGGAERTSVSVVELGFGWRSSGSGSGDGPERAGAPAP